MKNNIWLWILGAAGAGAAAMYLLDPQKGARRRSLIRDKAVGLSNDAREAISDTTRDLSNRAYGLIAETTKAITGTPIDELDTAENQL